MPRSKSFASKSQLMRRLEEVNKELWLVFSLFALAGIVNSVFASQRVVLGLYTLPTVVSAYLYGRRHATLTALASTLLLTLLAWFNPELLGQQGESVAGGKWLDIVIWGGTLIVTGYLMGTLCDHKADQLKELRETYNGVLLILRHFISKDHIHRESFVPRLGVCVENRGRARLQPGTGSSDVRAAALLHDIGKLDVSREVLHHKRRASPRSKSPRCERTSTEASRLLEPVGGSLRRVIPIILTPHHDRFDGTGYHLTRGVAIPVEARILSVADVYDSLTSDRPYRKAMSPFEGDVK